MIFSRSQQLGLVCSMVIIFGYTIMICIHQSRYINDYCDKMVWVKRNRERQIHGPAYRLDIANGIVPENGRNEIFHFSDGLANVSFHERWGFIDRSGKWVVVPRFTGAGRFTNGLAWVMRKDKFGFIDKTGRMVIWPQFDNVRDFSGGLAAVRIKKSWGFIDTSGRFVVQPTFEWADSFGEGLALVKKKGLYGYINPTGRLVIKPRFMDGLRFQEGLAGIQINGKYGFINPQGRIVIKPQFDQTAGFSEGVAAVKIRDSMGFIHRNGRMIFQGRFTTLGNFHKGVAITSLDNSVYLLDQTGKMTHAGFQIMQDFSGKYAAVGINVKITVKTKVATIEKIKVKMIQKYSFCDTRLDKNGERWYSEVWPYSQGLAAVQVGKRIGFLGNGVEAIKPEFDWVDPDKY